MDDEVKHAMILNLGDGTQLLTLYVDSDVSVKILKAVIAPNELKPDSDIPESLMFNNPALHGSDELHNLLRIYGNDPNNETAGTSVTIHTNLVLIPEGIQFVVNDETFVQKPCTIEEWEAWYTPERTLTDLLRGMSASDEIKPARRIRPIGAAKLQPLDKNLQLWTNTNLTKMVLDVTTSPAESWKPFEKRNGFTLETDSGMAILENVGTFDNLKKILDMLGPEGLQYTLATLGHIEDLIKRTYGKPPESRDDLKPIRIVVNDLLRSMDKKPDGNTFSRTQQLRPRHFLKAQNLVEYADIKSTTSGKARIPIGPLINYLDAELETRLPFDDIPNDGEVLSITVLPGRAVYEHIRKGVRWCHPQLLKYESGLKYEITIGLYMQQLALTRRNKQDQEYVAIGSIERGSGVVSFGKSSPRRRVDRIIKALNRLAQDGVIPGETDPTTKEVKAIFQQADNAMQYDAIESKRAMKVKVIDQYALPNGYEPLPCTPNQP